MPQIQRASHRHCALYKFTYLLTYGSVNVNETATDETDNVEKMIGTVFVRQLSLSSLRGR